jgi:hypothetical protein
MIRINAVEAGPAGPAGPTGNAGVLISATEPQDPNILVWIVDKGERDENGAIINAGISVRDGNGAFHPLESIMGSKPEKGVDYWTEADQASIKQYIDTTINTSGGVIVDVAVTQSGENPVSGAAVYAFVKHELEQERTTINAQFEETRTALEEYVQQYVSEEIGSFKDFEGGDF